MTKCLRCVQTRRGASPGAPGYAKQAARKGDVRFLDITMNSWTPHLDFLPPGAPGYVRQVARE